MSTPPPSPKTPRPPATDQAAASAGAEGVFLSPRVVDQQAYQDFAGALRTLIDRAAFEGAALRTVLERAEGLTEALRRSESGQQETLELIARALKRIDERTTRAEKVLEEMTGASAAAERFEARADQLIARKAEALEARVEAAHRAAAARVADLELRLTTVLSELESRAEAARAQAESVAGPTFEGLRAACERAERLIGATGGAEGRPGAGSLGDLVLRAETARQGTDFAARQLEGIRDQADRSCERLQGALSEITAAAERLTERGEAARVAAERALRETESSVRAVDQRVAEGRSALDAALGEAKPRAEAMAAELRELVRESRDAHTTTGLALGVLEGRLTQLREALAKLEPWEPTLLRGAGGPDLPEPIRAAVETVRRELRTDLASIAAALRGAAARADGAIEAVEGAAPVPVVRTRSGESAAKP